MKIITGFLLLALLPAAAGPVERLNPDQQMKIAIEQYDRGEDLDAMDRFMEVLHNGNASQRAKANEYMNLITQRMALGTKGGPARSSSARPRPRPEEGGEEAPRRGLSDADRLAMQKEIDGKLQARLRRALERLRRYEEVRIHMGNSRTPKAIGLPPGLLFGSGLQFKRGAVDILNLLAETAYCSGSSQLVLLPERAVLGDSKVLDMRRAMAVSSHFFKAGIAPARVRVNLLTEKLEIPQDMSDFQGMLLAFTKLPMTLTVDQGDDGGPPISLGVSPASIDPKAEQGAIVEFSVLESPSGLKSWRFQLRGRSTEPGLSVEPLIQLRGEAPAFHQVFWNGRKDYFGESLAPGRYECLLTATDSQGRSRTKREWITIEGGAPASLPPPPAPRPQPKPRPAARKRKPARPVRSPRPAKVPVAEQAIPEEAAVAAPAAPSPEEAPAGVVNYTVQFARNSTNIIGDGETTLGKLAETMDQYPLESIKLMGYANSQEPDPEGLADGRAARVAEILAKRYKLDSSRVRQKESKVTEAENFKVEIYIVPGS